MRIINWHDHFACIESILIDRGYLLLPKHHNPFSLIGLGVPGVLAVKNLLPNRSLEIQVYNITPANGTQRTIRSESSYFSSSRIGSTIP